MPRPPLPVGTYGGINRTQVGNSWRARASFRDYDGVPRVVEAFGPTATSAENALKEKLPDRAMPSASDITRETTVKQLASLWLKEITAEGRLAEQTIDRYRVSIDNMILPAFGGLRMRELTVSRVDRAFKTVAAKHPGAARAARSVCGLMLGMAVRHDALTANPVRDIGRLHRNRRVVRALDIEDLVAVRAAIRAWQTPANTRSGPRHSHDLADIVDVLLATGARIGEALASRWKDLDTAAQPPTLTISGTIVYVKGKGFYRQTWTKSDAGYRTIALPKFAVAVLERRRAEMTPNDLDAIFVSRAATWLSPHNVRRQWRAARKDTGLDWVVPHTFRKTVATLIDRETNSKTAAAQLGHESDEVTTTYYIQKARVAPDVSEVLDALGPAAPKSA